MKQQCTNPHYNVETTKSFIYTPGGFKPDGYFCTVRTDTMQVLGKVSARYKVIQNDDLLKAAEGIFQDRGLEFKSDFFVTKGGKRMNAQYTFRNHTKKMAKGDIIGFALTVGNGFDGMTRPSFKGGGLRLVCSNGMTAVEEDLIVTGRHSSGFCLQAMKDALEVAMVRWDATLGLYNKLAEVEITHEQGQNVLGRLEINNTVSGRMRREIQNIWERPTYAEDRERNLWNVYNAATQHLTHQVAKKRFDLAQRVSSDILETLRRAAYNPADLEALVAPLPENALN